MFAKLISNRLKPYIDKIISAEQTTFIKGRNIADNTILMKEVLHSYRDRRSWAQMFALKADINKAFDTVEWCFIKATLVRLGTPAKLVRIIMSRLSSSKVTVQVNDTGSGYITPTRGLKQGCPLSPYLYIIAMEFFMKAEEGLIKGVCLPLGAPRLTHALYADDVIFFGEVTAREAERIREILAIFGTHSRLTHCSYYAHNVFTIQNLYLKQNLFHYDRQ
jgi:Reverse transcriptase (RNA-dependent DNA polymerase)